MAEPFLGEIEAFAFNFAPRGWALCAGQVLPINQNTALFSLLGTTYGGNGTTTFQLPDLRGRVANAFGQGQGLGNYSLGQTGGQESHTLISERDAVRGPQSCDQCEEQRHDGRHERAELLRSVSEPPTPAERVRRAVNIYGTAAPTIAMGALAPTGGQPHENRMPLLGLNYCIALQGIFPSRN